MTKLRMLVELEYDADLMHGNNPESVKWFRDRVLLGEKLILHSNEIGDTIGELRVIDLPSGDYGGSK
jgi:hypothetical protein